MFADFAGDVRELTAPEYTVVIGKADETIDASEGSIEERRSFAKVGDPE